MGKLAKLRLIAVDKDKLVDGVPLPPVYGHQNHTPQDGHL